MDNNHEDPILVETAMESLKFAEYRLQTVGRLRDLLGELRALGSLLPTNTQADSVGVGGPSPSNVPDAFYSQLPVSSRYSDSVHTGGPSSSNVPDAFHSQLPASAGYSNNTLSSEQSRGPGPGMSVEELLADTDTKLYTMDGILDDELLSVWMTAPIDVSNIHHWDAYLENRNINGADGSWTSGYRELRISGR